MQPSDLLNRCGEVDFSREFSQLRMDTTIDFQMEHYFVKEFKENPKKVIELLLSLNLTEFILHFINEALSTNRDPYILYCRAKLYISSDKDQEAFEDVFEALSYDPNQIEAYQLLLRLKINSSLLARQIDHYLELLDQENFHASAYIAMQNAMTQDFTSEQLKNDWLGTPDNGAINLFYFHQVSWCCKDYAHDVLKKIRTYSFEDISERASDFVQVLNIYYLDSKYFECRQLVDRYLSEVCPYTPGVLMMQVLLNLEDNKAEISPVAQHVLETLCGFPLSDTLNSIFQEDYLYIKMAKLSLLAFSDPRILLKKLAYYENSSKRSKERRCYLLSAFADEAAVRNPSHVELNHYLILCKRAHYEFFLGENCMHSLNEALKIKPTFDLYFLGAKQCLRKKDMHTCGQMLNSLYALGYTLDQLKTLQSFIIENITEDYLTAGLDRLWENFQKTCERYPQDVQLRKNCLELVFYKGDHEAITKFQPQINLECCNTQDTKSRAIAMGLRGIIETILKTELGLKKAKIAFQLSYNEFPSSKIGLFLAMSLVTSSPDQALIYFDKYKKDIPPHSDTEFTYGLCLTQQGKYEESFALLYDIEEKRDHVVDFLISCSSLMGKDKEIFRLLSKKTNKTPTQLQYLRWLKTKEARKNQQVAEPQILAAAAASIQPLTDRVPPTKKLEHVERTPKNVIKTEQVRKKLEEKKNLTAAASAKPLLSISPLLFESNLLPTPSFAAAAAAAPPESEERTLATAANISPQVNNPNYVLSLQRKDLPALLDSADRDWLTAAKVLLVDLEDTALRNATTPLDGEKKLNESYLILFKLSEMLTKVGHTKGIFEPLRNWLRHNPDIINVGKIESLLKIFQTHHLKEEITYLLDNKEAKLTLSLNDIIRIAPITDLKKAYNLKNCISAELAFLRNYREKAFPDLNWNTPLYRSLEGSIFRIGCAVHDLKIEHHFLSAPADYCNGFINRTNAMAHDMGIAKVNALAEAPLLLVAEVQGYIANLEPMLKNIKK